MTKRMIALFVSLVLLLSLLPTVSLAVSRDELIASTKNSYLKAQEDAQQESFNGFCGRMTSYQLWNMGINSGLLTADGNKQYELYSGMKRTSGGYYTCSYSAEEYTLERALNVISCNGTKDVYNILVCFEWTNTEAGNIYGHAVVINGIMDGKVYFVESFFTQLGGEEGNVVICTIPEFANIFEDWTLFEGVVHFAGRNYAAACKSYPTDMFVTTRFAMDLRSEPCMVGTDYCKTVRSISAGERLRVTAVLRNTYGEWYYFVEDGDTVGYVVADTVVPYRTNTEGITLSRFELTPPEKEETDLQLNGRIRAEKGLVGTLEITVTDQLENEVISYREITDAYRIDLDDLNEQIDFAALGDGAYTLSIWAETSTAYVNQSELCYGQEKFLLHQQQLLIGDVQPPQQPETVEEPIVKNGWCWEDGVWYRYENDMIVTGWYNEYGITYYLQEDGSVATGKVEIDEQVYYFTETGAMCVGWKKTNQGMRYLLADGTVATGWQMINGSRYWFEDTGKMQTTGTRMDGDVKYRFHADGKAVVVRDPRYTE